MSKNSGQNSFQDWNNVVIGKKSIQTQLKEGTLKKEIVEKKGAAKNSQNLQPDNLRKIEKEEIGHLQTPSHSLSTQIQQARAAKKLTQDQLNNLCNFPKGTVASYEKGTIVTNPQHLQTMSRHLGIVLKKNA